MMITQDGLREVLDYDPLTGKWTWIARVANRIHIGDEAGSIGDKGYRVISIKNRDYKAHQLAWLYMTGEWPRQHIDHRNGVRSDNRWSNLRLASHLGNAQNAGKRRDNSSGFKGVYYKRAVGRWQAYIQSQGRRHWLGCYHTPEEAADAYRRAAVKFHGEFARTS